MESYELPSLNKPGPSATPITPAPGYDPRTDNHLAGVARNHYYQVPVEVPGAKPWYRRKACWITSIVIGIILLLAAIAVGLAVVFIMKDKDNDSGKDEVVTTAVPVIPTTKEAEPSTMTVTSRRTLTPSIHTVTLTKSAEESEEPSTLIQTITESEPEDIGGIISSLLTRYPYYTTELTTEVRTISNTIKQTLTREVTLTEEPEPEPTTEVVLTTQVVTISNTLERTLTAEVTVTEEHEPVPTKEVQISLITLTKVSNGPETTIYEPTTIMTTVTVDAPSTEASETSESSEASSSSDTEISEIFKTTSNSPSDSSTSIPALSTSPVTKSSTSIASSTTSSIPTSSSSPTISNNSSIAAVDVANAPSSLHRRLLVWQDSDDNLIVRDSVNGESTVSKVNSFLKDIPNVKGGSSITAAADNQGRVHVFYITKEYKIQHISQRKKDDWTDHGSLRDDFQNRTRLTATWHQSGNDTNILVLAHVWKWLDEVENDQFRIELIFSEDYGKSWESEEPTVFQNITIPDGGDFGISVASGFAWSDDADREEPKDGEFAGLLFMMEGRDGLEIIECEFEENTLDDCRVVDRQFHRWNADKGEDGESEPIEIDSHPTHLAWSQHRSNPNGPSKLHGLFRLDTDDGELIEFTYVTGIEGKASGGTTETHESMDSHHIQHKDTTGDDKDWMKAMATTEERTLFTRGGQSHWLLERVRLDDRWDTVGVIDTALT